MTGRVERLVRSSAWNPGSEISAVSCGHVSEGEQRKPKCPEEACGIQEPGDSATRLCPALTCCGSPAGQHVLLWCLPGVFRGSLDLGSVWYRCHMMCGL
ncbi:hypothetical protein GN956_G4731 [Arapaima gigas]